MASAILPIILMIVGALVFLSTDKKVSQLGLYTFAAGVFALAFNFASWVGHLGH